MQELGKFIMETATGGRPQQRITTTSTGFAGAQWDTYDAGTPALAVPEISPPSGTASISADVQALFKFFDRHKPLASLVVAGFFFLIGAIAFHYSQLFGERNARVKIEAALEIHQREFESSKVEYEKEISALKGKIEKLEQDAFRRDLRSFEDDCIDKGGVYVWDPHIKRAKCHREGQALCK